MSVQDIDDRTKIERFIAEDDSTVLEIELRDLKCILDEVVIEDYAAFHCEQMQQDLFGGYVVILERFVSDRVLQKILEFNSPFCFIPANITNFYSIWFFFTAYSGVPKLFCFHSIFYHKSIL